MVTTNLFVDYNEEAKVIDGDKIYASLFQKTIGNSQSRCVLNSDQLM